MLHTAFESATLFCCIVEIADDVDKRVRDTHVRNARTATNGVTRPLLVIASSSLLLSSHKQGRPSNALYPTGNKADVGKSWDIVIVDEVSFFFIHE